MNENRWQSPLPESYTPLSDIDLDLLAEQLSSPFGWNNDKRAIEELRAWRAWARSLTAKRRVDLRSQGFSAGDGFAGEAQAMLPEDTTTVRVYP